MDIIFTLIFGVAFWVALFWVMSRLTLHAFNYLTWLTKDPMDLIEFMESRNR
jgi:hypothetical protein